LSLPWFVSPEADYEAVLPLLIPIKENMVLFEVNKFKNTPKIKNHTING